MEAETVCVNKHCARGSTTFNSLEQLIMTILTKTLIGYFYDSDCSMEWPYNRGSTVNKKVLYKGCTAYGIASVALLCVCVGVGGWVIPVVAGEYPSPGPRGGGLSPFPA